MKLSLFIFFLLSSFLFATTAPDTLYKINERGIYHIQVELISIDSVKLVEKAPVLRSYYDKREYVYIAYSDAIAGDSTSRIHDRYHN